MFSLDVDFSSGHKFKNFIFKVKLNLSFMVKFPKIIEQIKMLPHFLNNCSLVTVRFSTVQSLRTITLKRSGA